MNDANKRNLLDWFKELKIDKKLNVNVGGVTSGVEVPVTIGGTTADTDNTPQVNTKVLPVGGIVRNPAALTAYTVGDVAQQQHDLNGIQMVNPGDLSYLTDSVLTQQGESVVATYSAATGSITVAGATTDFATITGSATKVVRLKKIRITGLATANANANILLVKRSTANTGGTSADVTEVPYDSGDGAATATVLSYTANPTTGTLVGTLSNDRVFLSSTTAVYQDGIEYVFTEDSKKSITLRGTSEVVGVNLNGATIAGAIFNVYFEWTEATT